VEQVRSLAEDLLAKSADAQDARVIAALAEIGDASLVDIFTAGLETGHKECILAGLEGLEKAAGKQVEIEQMGEFLDHEDKDIALTAARAYTNAADRYRGTDATACVKLLRKVPLLKDVADEDLATAVNVLGAEADTKSYDAISKLLERKPAVREAAAEALVAIAGALLGEGATTTARTSMKAVIKASTTERTLVSAAERLNQAGGDMDPLTVRGAVANWWLAGPIPGRMDFYTQEVIPTDGAVNLAASVEYEGEKYSWKHVKPQSPSGRLDFEEIIGGATDDAGLLAYAELVSPASMPAVMLIGSDDDIRCWLNGEEVHSFFGNRNWEPDTDRAEVQILEGTNTLLVKFAEDKHAWVGSVMFVDQEDRPLHLEQRTE
jgi:hypothetical protein